MTDFEWDEGKDAENGAKHGLSFDAVARLDWDHGLEILDDREDYGEDRFIRTAMLDGTLCACVFTEREDRLRIISLRKATKREIRLYEQAIGRTPYG
ncbi:MAG: BrnT family toxin [Pseudomonadota bacterium]